jgi:hypothetical protein
MNNPNPIKWVLGASDWFHKGTAFQIAAHRYAKRYRIPNKGQLRQVVVNTNKTANILRTQCRQMCFDLDDVNNDLSNGGP